MHVRIEGEPGIQYHMRDIGSYYTRVAGCEKCIWASVIFEHSGRH